MLVQLPASGAVTSGPTVDELLSLSVTVVGWNVAPPDVGSAFVFVKILRQLPSSVAQPELFTVGSSSFASNKSVPVSVRA